MRACRFGLVESSNSVARLLLEPHDRTVAAAVLLDNLSTCILVSLLNSTSSAPGSKDNSSSKHKQLRLRVPPCSSDACFLRVQVHGYARSGEISNSRMGHGLDKSAEGFQLQFGQFTAPMGPVVEQSGNSCDDKLGHCFFLVASPGAGSSSTDIRAWSCDKGNFRQVFLETGVLRSPRDASAKMTARLGIPHVGLKMVASVNVVAIYSPSAGKIWIFAAKTREQMTNSSKFPSTQASLLLLNCAVIECSGPVYALHLSMQHLFLGENGGVRVFPVRPLVKRRKAKNVMKQATESNAAALCGEKHQTKNHEELLIELQGGSGSLLNGLCEPVSLVVKKNGYLKQQGKQGEVSALGNENHTGIRCEVGNCIDREEKQRERNGFISENGIHLATQASKEGEEFESFYAAFTRTTSNQQAVAIHPLSAKAFVVLDSSGMVHMLNLRKLASSKGRSRSPESSVIQVETRPIEVSFHVSSVAVIPSGSETAALRKLWVSDGIHSLYVLSISEEIPSGEGNIIPQVTQVLFTGVRVDFLVAVSAETVLALAEGSLVAYVKAGS